MRKYLLHVLIISFVFLLAPAAHVASYAGGLEDAKEEVRKYPDSKEAHLKLGRAYVQLNEVQEAIKSYKQAIWIDPDYATAHIFLAGAYELESVITPFSIGKQKGIQKAIKHYEKAIICADPADKGDIFIRKQSHYGLGLIYIFRSRDRSAVEEQIEKLRDLGERKLATRLEGMIFTELD